LTEDIITEVVANSADIATNCRIKILSVTVFNANSSGSSRSPEECPVHHTYSHDRYADVDQGAEGKCE
jgi:hypothetical protein